MDKFNLTFLRKISPIFLFLGMQTILVMFFSPDVERGGDSIQKWLLSVKLSQSEFQYFDYTNHHHLRWGSWLIPYILNNFLPDNVYTYFLASVIPTTIAAIVFIIFINFTIGPVAAILFCFLWIIDPEIYRGTFQLRPTGQGFLPLSLICLYILYIGKKKVLKIPDIAVISFLFFWLYGVKETNLFFVPGIMLYLYIRYNLKHLIIFLIILVILYCLESIFLLLIFDIEDPFGRISLLLSENAIHLNAMTGNKILLEQNEFLWGGWALRLFQNVHPYHTLAYFTSALLSIFYINRNKINEGSCKNIYIYIIYLLLSYLIINLLFITDVNPLTLGQPLRGRYLAILLPLSFIVITVFVVSYLKKPSFQIMLIGTLLFFSYISYPLQWHFKKDYTSGFNSQDFHLWRKSIFTYDLNYKILSRKIEKSDCLFSTDRKNLQYKLHMIPSHLRGKMYNQYIKASIQDDNGNHITTPIANDDPNMITYLTRDYSGYFYIKTNEICNSYLQIQY